MDTKIKDIVKAIMGKVKPEEVVVSLETQTLEDGTVLEANAFVVGEAVVVKGEDGDVPAPEGEHKLEGITIVVDAEGVIVSVEEDAQEEEEAPAEDAVEEATEVSAAEEAPVEEAADAPAEEFITVSRFEEVMSIMMDELEAVKAKLAEAEAVEAAVEVEMAKEVSKMPASTPLKHNPEEVNLTANRKALDKYSLMDAYKK